MGLLQSSTGLADAAQALLGELPVPPQAERLQESVRPIPTTEGDSPCAAVDGGSAVLLDLGASGTIALRAGFTIRHPGDAFRDPAPIERIRTVRRGHLAEAWQDVLLHAWGVPVAAPPMQGSNGLRLWADAERTVLEADAAHRALRELAPGSLLLLDGALAGDSPIPEVTLALQRAARHADVGLVALSKDSSLSLTGALPLPLELEGLARRAQWPEQFYVDVTPALGLEDGEVRVFGARFDRHARVYRVDVDVGLAPRVPRAFAQIARLCNDPAYPGYPYPLARIHNRVHFSGDESTDLRRGLERVVTERHGSWFGMRLFGRGRDVLALGG